MKNIQLIASILFVAMIIAQMLPFIHHEELSLHGMETESFQSGFDVYFGWVAVTLSLVGFVLVLIPNFATAVIASVFYSFTFISACVMLFFVSLSSAYAFLGIKIGVSPYLSFVIATAMLVISIVHAVRFKKVNKVVRPVSADILDEF